MPAVSKNITTQLGYSTPDRVFVRGMDLSGEILGNLNLGDMAYLVLKGAVPKENESRLFNAIVITLVEHGITPSALAARLTYTGAPESMQAAIAAGLSGLGSVFVGSMEGAAKMLVEAIPYGTISGDIDLDSVAKKVVAQYREAKRIIPGLGHPVHKPIDPRAGRLIELARECKLEGPYVRLMTAIHEEAERQSGRSLPLNATGAIGAICCEFEFPWTMVRGIGVMARSIGLVGHIMEEASNPIGMEIWARADKEALSHELQKQ